MDQEEIKNLILERFQNLQPEIQNIILNEDYDRKLIEIGKRFNLSNEQTENLEFNTTLVLLGNTHPDEYKNELMGDLKIDENTANQITSDINNEILKDVLSIIKQNFIEDDLVEKEEQEKMGSVTETEEIPLPPYKEEELPITNNELQIDGAKKEENDEVPLPQYEEEIPLPHYNESPIPKTEHEFYKETHKVLKDSGIDIIESKLFNTTISAPTVSDHSLPKMGDK